MRYIGPHLVIEVKNPIMYKIKVNGKDRMVHASKMKRDPAANRLLEVYEDDILDVEDMNMEYENINDVEVEENNINEDGDYINEEGYYEDDMEEENDNEFYRNKAYWDSVCDPEYVEDNINNEGEYYNEDDEV